MKLKRKPFYAALILVILAAVSAAILATVNLFTKVDETEQFLAKVAVFYPDAVLTETLDISGYENLPQTEIKFAVKLSDGALAVLAKSKKAYSADGIQLLVFFKGEEISAVKKYSASETPGIGSKVVSEEYLNRYVGKSAEEFRKAEDSGGVVVDAITGATKTSTGVNYAMTAAANFCLWEARR